MPTRSPAWPACPRMRRATTNTSSRSGVALQRGSHHREAVTAFLQALALQPNDAMTHYRLGMAFKDQGLKAEAAECVRTALLLGLDHQRTRRAGPARLPRARGLPLAAGGAGPRRAAPRRAGGAGRHSPRDRRVRACGARRRPARTAQGRAALCAARRVARAAAVAAPGQGPRRPDAHRLPVGRLPPARHQPVDGADAGESRPRPLRGHARLGRAGRRQCDAPPHRRCLRALRGRARPRRRGRRAAHPRAGASTSWSMPRAPRSGRCCR